jgi:hypothetical protein
MARRPRVTVLVLAISLAGAGLLGPDSAANADECPVPAGGRWTGFSVSTVDFAVHFDDAQLSFASNGSMTGTLSVDGGPLLAVTGTIDCADITFGVVAPAITFEGTLTLDGRSASGTYTNGPDSGTWSSAADPYVLTTTSTVEPTTIAPAGAASWVIEVENSGTAASTQTIATFDLDGDGTFGPLSQTSVSQGPGCQPDSELSDVLECNLGTILPGARASATVSVVSTGNAGTSIVAGGSAAAFNGGGTDDAAPDVTISVVAPANLPVGTASGVAKPGVKFSTPGKKATPANPILVTFKLPKRIKAGGAAARSTARRRHQRSRIQLMSLQRLPKAKATVVGPIVPMSLSHSAREAATFCGGSACSGDVIHLTPFSGYRDRKHPAKVTITWDASVRGRGTASLIYKRADATTASTRTLPACIKAGSLGYANLPCVSKKKIVAKTDVQYTILMLSGDPKFARR